MDVNALIIVATVAMILYFVGGKFFSFYLFYRRLNKIPGPMFAIPLVGIVFELIKLPKEDRLDWLEKLSHRYKDGFFRAWIGTTGCAEIRKPEHIEVVLRSNKQITKSKAYNFLRPWLGRGLLTSTGTQWFHSRKLITPAFHFGVLEEFAGVMIDKTKILIDCIQREIKIHGEKPFDIFPLGGRCGLDIICETAMGVNIHAQEEIENEYTKAVNTISSGIVSRFFRPWLMWDWIFFKTSTGKAFKAAVETSHIFCTRVIERKQQERKSGNCENDELNLKSKDESGQSKKKAFLDLLLEANEKEDNPLTIEEIRDQTNTFMFAGHDTTGTLVGWTLFCIGNDLQIQRKVHEELDQVLGDSDDQACLKLMHNLKYLETVIKEVLRLYPSIPVISRDLTDDVQIGDYTIPKGTVLSIEIYKLHRDPSVWPDPLRFDPDRFLPENIKTRHPYAYVPFSAGPRNCIGQKYAMLEAKVILIQVLRNFTVKSIENHSTIKKCNDISLGPAHGIYVNMKKR